MAHLVRPWTTRYLDAAGKQVKKSTPGATKVRERSAMWCGQGVPGYPKSKRIPLSNSKTTARKMLEQLVKDAELGHVGIDATAERSKGQPLEDHLTEWEAALRRKDTGEAQIAQQLSRVRRTLEGAGIKTLTDLVASAVGDKVADHIRGRIGKPRSEGGISVQTANHYQQAMRQFSRWLVSRRRLARDPFTELTAGDARLDMKHARRALSGEELERWLATTKASKKEFRGLTGTDRHALYLLALSTGFRRRELASLTPAHFSLDTDPPTITLARKRTKNRKGAAQPLPSFVAALLRPRLAKLAAGATVWPGTWFEKSARMLRKDLEEAKIPYVVQGINGPEFFDFHATRHTFVTLTVESGADPKTAQALARHSDVRLTLERYTHEEKGRMGRAVDKLALPGRPGGTAITAEHLAIATVILSALAGAILSPRQE